MRVQMFRRRRGHTRRDCDPSHSEGTIRVRVVVSFFILSVLLLISTAASAAGQVVYKWKDSGGVVHYTDTPPPADATLLNGPKPAPGRDSRTAPSSAWADKPLLSAPCRSDITAAECDAARLGLQADLEDLKQTAQEGRKSDQRAMSKDEVDGRVAMLRAKECSDMRNVLMHLRDRQSRKSKEILTAEERASVPAQIEQAEGAITRSCE